MSLRELGRTLRQRLTARRLGVVVAVVTLGWSQIVLRLVAENIIEFPYQASFHAGLLFWVWLLPAAAALAADLALVKDDEVSGRPGRAWRAALYAICAVSFARQLQTQYAPRIIDDFEGLDRLAALVALVSLLAALIYRVGARLHAYFAVLGLLGLLLVGRFAWTTELYGPAWFAPVDPLGHKPAGNPAKPPVFILLFDELSFDQVAGLDGRPDPARYPHLARLADDSLWFVDATTNSGYTRLAVRLLLSGRLRDDDKDDKAPLLFDLLPEGYVSEAIVAWPAVSTWIRHRQASNPRFVQHEQASLYLPPFFEIPGQIRQALAISPVFNGANFFKDLDGPGGDWTHRTADDRLFIESDALLDVLREEKIRGKLLYWHTSLPHFPFQLDETGHPHRDPNISLLKTGSYAAVLSNYRRQAQAVDVMVGRFTRALKERGLYEDAIVVLTSDHGLRTWGQDKSRREPVDDRLARVPLLIKAPGLAPGVSHVDYQHVDFVPTVLDLLGASPPPHPAGVSALVPGDRKRRKWMDWSGTVYWRTPGRDEWRTEKP